MKFDLECRPLAKGRITLHISDIEAGTLADAIDSACEALREHNVDPREYKIWPAGEYADRTLIAQVWAERTGNRPEQLAMGEDDWAFHLAIVKRARESR